MSTLRALITRGMTWCDIHIATLYDWLTLFYITLAINKVDGHGLSYTMHHAHLPKKLKEYKFYTILAIEGDI